MASTGLTSFEYNNPRFPNPELATSSDWAFFSKNIWQKSFGSVDIHVGWSNDYDIDNGHYICKLAIEKDWVNPIEELHTRSSQEVNLWLYDRVFHLAGE